MTDSSFESLGLIEPLLKALVAAGYERPTPIQSSSIPSLLEGRDLLGCAQTGTGKTAAFALPIIQLINAKPKKLSSGAVRALVVSPTRELAAQTDESFAAYSKYLRLTRACVFGGVGKAPQERALSRGVDVLTATPGRLLDLQGEGKLRLNEVEVVVLDEADRMLDMGFIHDVKRIIALLPAQRQNLLFSATMPESIAGLAAKILRNPVRVDISPDKPTVELIDQSIIFAEKDDKRRLLSAYITGQNVQRALVFTRTKHGADRLVKQLEHDGISSAAIHANKSQNNRIKTLEGFRAGDIRILVATDLAARGIDVDGITHVFNFELPNEPETYVHRIGRTARAGASGIAIAFCDSEEKGQLHDIERLIGRKIPLAYGPAIDEAHKAAAAAKAAEPPREPDARDREPYFSRSGRERPRPAGDRGAPSGRRMAGDRPASGRDRPMRPDRPAHTERTAHSDRPAQGRAAGSRAPTVSRAAQAVREVSGRIDGAGRPERSGRGGSERRPANRSFPSHRPGSRPR